MALPPQDVYTAGQNPDELPMPFFPTDLTSFLEAIRQNGDIAYSLMFAWASSHSLLLTLFGGYAAHSGALNYNVLLVVCALGSFSGDVVRFAIGRRFGSRILARWPRVQKAVDIVARLAGSQYLWMILLHRYPNGVRGVAGFAYGMSELRWVPFLLASALAASIWSVALVSIGYAFGQVSEKVLTDASSAVGGAMLVGFLLLSWWIGKRLEDAAFGKPAAPNPVAAAPGSDAARRQRRQRRRQAG